MTISKHLIEIMKNASWIRKMFEEGARLKTMHGPENVFDFSLGNPNVPQPELFRRALAEVVEDSAAGDHGYTPNAGLPFVRKAVADHVSSEQNVRVSQDDIIMTCGAAGGLNVILKTILEPGEEVLSPAPFFPEYRFYAQNHGGVLKTAASTADFDLDIEALDGQLTAATKAVLINSPNNPTGQVYSREKIQELAGLLEKKGKVFNKTIYLISDEPYRKITYDGIEVPRLFELYDDSIITTSHSKDLSLPGERIGFIAVNPRSSHREGLEGGMTLANRILGFVNAPALMQRVVARLQDASADMGEYARKKELICSGLKAMGYDFMEPKGAFYLFPKAPGSSDVEFVRELQKELILAVPGTGFGGPGHFRLAFCVADETITGAMEGFEKVMKKFTGR